MQKAYTPVWTDDVGNKMIMLSPATVFPAESQARELSESRAAYLVPFGLTPDGVVGFEVNHKNEAQIESIAVEQGPLRALCIRGPIFDAHKRRDENAH